MSPSPREAHAKAAAKTLSIVTICAGLLSCDSAAPGSSGNPSAKVVVTSSASASTTAGRVRLIAAPADDLPVGEVVATVQNENPGIPVVIYVGAEWCEPCKRFHKAATNRQLDASLGDVAFVEFDRDRDETRLTKAGCITKLVPTFAIPDAQGRCSNRIMQGGIKGPGAVGNLDGRLRRFLRL